MCGSMADIQSLTAEIRRGKKERKKERKKEETTGQKYNGLPYSIGRPQQARGVETLLWRFKRRWAVMTESERRCHGRVIKGIASRRRSPVEAHGRVSRAAVAVTGNTVR